MYMEWFTLIGAVVLGIISALTLLVTFALPLGEFTLGGRYKVLPLNLRVISAISCLVQWGAIFSILSAGGVITVNFLFGIEKWLCIFFGIYLLINTLMNAVSLSKKEKYVMTSLSLLTSICFLVVGFLS